jgi:hypothetical protein
MQVVSLVNGSLISHTTAIYALHYAKQLGINFSLVYIRGMENIDEVKNSIEDVQDLASSFGMKNDFITFENLNELKHYIEVKDVDMLFCSSRQYKSIYDKSFVTSIIKKELKVDIAVVKVVKIGRAYSIDKIIMPIRDAKLSVKKFTLFSAFSLAYNAKSEIYSIDKISRMNLASISIENIKERLQSVMFSLRHYLRLGKMMNFKFAVKHDYTFIEDEKVQTHIAKHGYDLIIVGGHHEKSLFWTHPIDVLFDKPMVNTIYFIPFKDEV